MKVTLFRTFAIVLLAIFTCCKKKEIQGPKGDPGTPGKGGTSNIEATSQFMITFAEWVADTAAGSWTATVKNSLLTKEVVDKAAVKVYISINGYWWELPYVEGDYPTQFGFDVGILKIKVTAIHGGLPKRPLTATYRLVIITESP